MRSLIRLTLCLALAAAPCASAQTMEPAQRYLLAASRLYQSLEYERALEQVKRARSVTGGVADDAAIARYEGVLLYELGKKDEAVAAFREALYLEPDAALPLKVSPKIADAFESMRVSVKKELAPLMAKRRAEEEARRQTEERTRLAAEDAARTEAAAREAQLRVEAEEARRKADEARRKQLADFTRREDEAKQAEARLDEARKALETESKRAEERRKAEAEAELARKAALDRPVERSLTPREPPPAPVSVQRTVPVAPIVFGGLTAVAGGVAATFGIFANQQLAAARAAQFQSDTAAELRRAQDSALITNVAIGVAGVAAVATLISLVVSGAPPPPPPAEVTP